MHIPFYVLLLLFWAPTQLHAQDSGRIQLPPNGNNFADTTIPFFMHELKTAALEKDTGKLGLLVDHENIYAFTTRGLAGIAGMGKNGWESFKIVFHLDKNPEDSYLWKALVDFIDFGGQTDSLGINLYLPGYRSSSYLLYPPPADLSYQLDKISGGLYNSAFVMGQNIAVYAKPDSSSAIVDTLSYELVLASPLPYATDQWDIGHNGPLIWRMKEITTLNNRVKGWVDGRKIYPWHFRFTATKKNNRWLLTDYFPPF